MDAVGSVEDQNELIYQTFLTILTQDKINLNRRWLDDKGNYVKRVAKNFVVNEFLWIIWDVL